MPVIVHLVSGPGGEFIVSLLNNCALKLPSKCYAYVHGTGMLQNLARNMSYCNG